MSSAAVYDVAGIGNAIVAVVVTVKPGFLLEYGPPPGDMVLVPSYAICVTTTTAPGFTKPWTPTCLAGEKSS